MSYIIHKFKPDPAATDENYITSEAKIRDRKPELSYFYEIEPGVVLDIILDDEHPEFKNHFVDIDDYPKRADDSEATLEDPDYSWIGRIKVRRLVNDRGVSKELINWAVPIENTGVTEWPLINEVVALFSNLDNPEGGTLFYSRKINLKSNINTNADFTKNRSYGKEDFVRKDNVGENVLEPIDGPESVISNTEIAANIRDVSGVLGSRFKFNHKIRALKRYEGDTILESRFGSSIRFGAYDENPENDNGENDYSDSGGNPMILLRNRQKSVLDMEGAFINKSYTLEDVNKDGTSIQITSGKTVSKFITTVDTPIFQENKLKEQSTFFFPKKKTAFKIPTYKGDQLLVNSDRLIFSSKAEETLFFSKKRFAITTDDEYTVDSKNQMVFTTEDKFIVDVNKELILTTNKVAAINSPTIYLGEYGENNEPILLGRTTVIWLTNLCDILIKNIEVQIKLTTAMIGHSHITIDGETGSTDSKWGAEIAKFIKPLEEQINLIKEQKEILNRLLSTKVFTVGGGGAKGKGNSFLYKAAPPASTNKSRVAGRLFGAVRGAASRASTAIRRII
jgi:hypothetical protein